MIIGIMIGIPEVGDVEIVFAYEVYGNIDSISIKLGFDLALTVLGITETCGDFSPSVCPVYIYSGTFNFADNCGGSPPPPPSAYYQPPPPIAYYQPPSPIAYYQPPS